LKSISRVDLTYETDDVSVHMDTDVHGGDVDGDEVVVLALEEPS
jgi:hypothetical protein